MYLEKNRRRYSRRAAFIIAEYTIGEETHRDVIKNISAGGLFVRSWKKVAAGQAITLRFPLFSFEEHIVVVGIVSRLHPMGFAVTFDKPIDGLICKEGYFPEIVHESDQLARKIDTERKHCLLAKFTDGEKEPFNEGAVDGNCEAIGGFSG